MQKKQIIVNGNIVSYLITDDFKPWNATVFMHGRANDKYSFQNILNIFEQKNFSFISIDFPGFGESPKPKQDWWVQEYANFIQEFLAKLELKSINIVAHSFGGRVAIYLSANKLIDINKQVLIASWGIKPKQNNIKLFLVKLVKNILLTFRLKGIYQKIQNKVRSIDYKNAKDMEQIFLNIISYDLISLLPQIQVPTKLIRGTNDDQTPLFDGQIMNEKIINSSLFLIKWWTHFVHIEHYKVVFEQIKKFLFDDIDR